jgi:RNA polymerase sigma-70 factor, ECF subfamily
MADELPERDDPGTDEGNRAADAVVGADVTVATAPHPADVRPEPQGIAPDETGDQIFNRLVLPEVDVMWRVAMSLTRNRADAEDLVQESLLRAYKAIDSFDGRYPRAWLLTILRNTERNRHRRRRPELLSDPDIAEERGPRTEPDEVERRAEDSEFDAAVTAALAQLPENFRRVVELVDVDGLSYQEAADLLDVPLGTVMSRLHRARRRIRELLVPAGFGPGPVSDRTPDEQAADQLATDPLTPDQLSSDPQPGPGGPPGADPTSGVRR